MSRILLSISLLVLSTTAFAPGGVGNGGDPRILRFKHARIEAAGMVGKVAIYPELIQDVKETPRYDYIKVTRFLTATDIHDTSVHPRTILSLIAGDILASPHVYDMGEGPYCAWTNRTIDGRDPQEITLYLKTCERYLTGGGRIYAVETLIHETVHHFLRDMTKEERDAYGIEFHGTTEKEIYDENEDFCDKAARAVTAAFEKAVEMGVPHWKDISVEHQGLEERGFHTAVWTGETDYPATANRMIVWGGCKEDESTIYGCGGKAYFKSGGMYSPERDGWTRTDERSAPEARANHSAVWTGTSDERRINNKMVVWGGCTDGDGCERYLNTGGIFDPASNSWMPTPVTSRTPVARAQHTAVWTGKKLIVWGGENGINTPQVQGRVLNDGGMFDPASPEGIDPWEPIGGIIEPRSFHTAVWTGSVMIVWGGCSRNVPFMYCSNYFDDGAVFNPQTKEWSKIEAEGTPPSPRMLHTAVWIPGRQMMVVWGGQRSERFLGDGAILDLSQRPWKWRHVMSMGPQPRSRHTSVWTGDEMVVFGGQAKPTEDPDSYSTSVAAYKPPVGPDGAGSWRTLLDGNLSIDVKNHTAVWAENQMIIWGGQSSNRGFENVGVAFFPGQN